MSFSQSFQRRDAAAQLASEAVERPEWLVNTKPSPHFDVLCRLFESLRDKPQKRRDQIVSMIQASSFGTVRLREGFMLMGIRDIAMESKRWTRSVPLLPPTSTRGESTTYDLSPSTLTVAHASR